MRSTHASGTEDGTEIHGSSWDIKRAFDSVSKPILQMSWQRLGVLRHIANLVHSGPGQKCLTIPLTPHAMRIMSHSGLSSFDLRPSCYYTASGIYSETGTPQGDTPSPANWNAALDVLLRALHDIDPTPLLLLIDSVFIRLRTLLILMYFSQYRLVVKDYSLRRTQYQPSSSSSGSK